jgi:hypothetical protein
MRNGYKKRVQGTAAHALVSVHKRSSSEESWRLNPRGTAPSQAVLDWIDRVIVPALVQDYIRQSQQKGSVVPDSLGISGQSDEIAK